MSLNRSSRTTKTSSRLAVAFGGRRRERGIYTDVEADGVADGPTQGMTVAGLAAVTPGAAAGGRRGAPSVGPGHAFAPKTRPPRGGASGGRSPGRPGAASAASSGAGAGAGAGAAAAAGTPGSPSRFVHPAAEATARRATEPKVYVPHDRRPGMPPRRIEVERKRREFAAQDLSQLLLAEQVDYSAPGSADGSVAMQEGGPVSVEALLPLEAFDDTSFECREPTEWIELARADAQAAGDGEGGFVPARALRVNEADGSGAWERCRVVSYDPVSATFGLEWEAGAGGATAEGKEEAAAGGASASLPRIRICFDGEDPAVFAARVGAAHAARRAAEGLVKYNLYVDCMPTEDVPGLDSEQVTRVISSAISVQSLRNKAADTPRLLAEVNVDFVRTMNKIVLDRAIRHSRAEGLLPLVDLPDNHPILSGGELPPAPHSGVVATPAHDFAGAFSRFAFRSHHTVTDAIDLLQRVQAENIVRVRSTPFLHGESTKPLRVEDFEQQQTVAMTSFTTMLRDMWVLNIRGHIRSCLGTSGKGAYNLRESNRTVYEMSKLRKLLNCINFMMADALRSAVIAQLESYERALTDAADVAVRIGSTSDVRLDFASSRDPKRERRNPLFLVDIVVKEEEVAAEAEESKGEEGEEGDGEDEEVEEGEDEVPRTRRSFAFGTPIASFLSAPVEAVSRALLMQQKTPQVERLVMDRLIWANDPVLPAVYHGEDWVVAAMSRIREALAPCGEVAAAFLQTFDRFESFLNVDVDHTIRQLEEENAEEFKLPALARVVSRHRAAAHDVLDSIPAGSVNIGLFSVQVGDVRQLLARKHNDIADRVMALIAKRATEVSSAVAKQFRAIDKQLSVQPRDIEQLTELKEFAATCADKVKELQARIDKNTEAYDMLAKLRYPLSRDQFDSRYQAYRGPRQVHDKLDLVSEQLEQAKMGYMADMEREQAEFDDHLNLVHTEVIGLAKHTDLSRFAEVAAQVRKIKKWVADAKEQADLFNAREGLFNKDMTEYTRLQDISKQFEPYCMLWETVADWHDWHRDWTTDPFTSLDSNAVEKSHALANRNMVRCVKAFERLGNEGCLEIARELRGQVEEFKPLIPLVVALRNPGMRERHWGELSDAIGQAIDPAADGFTLTTVREMGLEQHLDGVMKVGEKAGKEYQIEQALLKMREEWAGVDLVIEPYGNSGSYVLKEVEELQAILDEHITQTAAMAFSAFKEPFKEDIEEWSATLNRVSDVLDEWIKVQRAWLYLQPIFDSPDIQKQLPKEYKRFNTVDKNWRSTLQSAFQKPRAIDFCNNDKLLERFKESNTFLDLVQKELSAYLETKRAAFTRFYFLSDAELLDILSSTKDPRAVQDHLKKCFDGLNKVEFDDQMRITHLMSAQKERIPCTEAVDPRGKNVEHWMTELEAMMRRSIKDVLLQASVDYLHAPRIEWIQKWPAQCVLNGSQLHWTRLIEQSIREKGADGVKHSLEVQRGQLSDMVKLVRSMGSKMSKVFRTTMSALTVLDVHAREVTSLLLNHKVATLNDFNWISQMRYYWHPPNEPAYPQLDGGSDMADELTPEGDMWVMMVSSNRPYGYEYIGNSMRLVITPLTDKCYLTLMGALQMNLGGAPAGPAGTGKTETVKDLAKALAKQCVVFNCSDGLDFRAMGKFFKGLASCGAWACFDEFNRIDVEVLSVVAQQIITLQTAVNAGEERITFMDSEIRCDPNFAVYITMNPGYAGRTELPDNLKALFRPVAMMVPDYALIGEIMLFSFGFEEALVCASKMVATFKLCSEQLSSQDHYDYGMRAVKTVITAAGNLKRQCPDENEQVLLYRALQDVNLPKFLAQDLPLFKGIISDLFPGIQRPNIDYGDLLKAITYSCETLKDPKTKKPLRLQPVPVFMTKCIQLYETIVVRHGLMLVGPTGGGKSMTIQVLKSALTELAVSGRSGAKIGKVLDYIMNPKAITMGQLYGESDPNTQEWKDGVLAGIVRKCADSNTPDLKWVIFDGPVDAIWIENMNTVLDDNKKLCLVSGEMINLSPEMNIMFEVEDLAVASPATVSRCGMVYMEPTSLGLDPVITSWLERLPPIFQQKPEAKRTLQQYFDTYLNSSLTFLRRHLQEPVPTVDNQLVRGLCNILDCFFERWFEKEGRDPPTAEQTQAMLQQLPSLFLFALVWSVAATTNGPGRRRFDAFLRSEMAALAFPNPFPETGLLYDFSLDQERGVWVPWMDTVEPFQFPAKAAFHQLTIPTKDTVRYRFLGRTLLLNRRPVLMTGPTGTGKTVNVNGLLSEDLPSNYVQLAMTFSAQTSANQVQDTIDSKMDKRARGTFGPTVGSYYVLFVDDLNMPQREEYFAQPPIELLRQWCDYGGWYDRKEHTFRHIVDTLLIGAMGPPGGGRNPMTARMIRHFNVINYAPMDDDSMRIIFGTILGNFLSSFEEPVRQLSDKVVTASIRIYNTICDKLLPTPTKPHYTFNLRDLGGLIQGMLMGSARKISTAPQALRLWVHEANRVFRDRLINDTDREWFDSQIRGQLEGEVGASWDQVVPESGLIVFGDYMVPGADPKVYDEVRDLEKLIPTIEEYLGDFNEETNAPMKLVMFMDAVGHVSRVSRVLRQPEGNALLLGVGGSGRQSLATLATFMAGYELKKVEISKGYNQATWREDIKLILMKAGLEGVQTVFLFSDTQIVFEGMVEDINNILNGGDVPNLYNQDDLEAIYSAMFKECKKRGIKNATPINRFATYISLVRANMHVVFTMSPVGEAFRERLRKFPALVNCCTIDWFDPWPDEALRSVGESSLNETDLGLGESLNGCVEFFRMVHKSVADGSKEFLTTLRRHNYVTPTSYLELLSTFRVVLDRKRTEVGQLKGRLQKGLDAISAARVTVAELQADLEAKQPILEETQTQVAEMIERVTADQAAASVKEADVSEKEAEASRIAAETKAMADEAQAELDKALPALDEAVKVLDKLKRNDITELKAIRNPTPGVRLTMEAACTLFKVAPQMVPDPDRMGKKKKSYWEPASKTLLSNPNQFLADMKSYKDDNVMDDDMIAAVKVFMDNEDFSPDVVGRASIAALGVCKWVRAMYFYATIAKTVEPKRRKVSEAQEELDRRTAQLDSLKAELHEVQSKVAELNRQLGEAQAKAASLQEEVDTCQARLERAQKLLGGLGGEQERWAETVKHLEVDFTNVVGDALVSSGTIAYLGAFTPDFRQRFVTSWQGELERLSLPHTPDCNLRTVLADPVKVRSWNIAGLPTDNHSVENAIIMDTARRWPLLVDPQGQANRYIKNLGGDKRLAPNGMDVVRLSEPKKFASGLENGVRFGRWVLLENVGEALDAQLEPVLLQQKFKVNGADMIKIGDSVIPYNDDFRFFITTKFSNPHYPPEVCVKVSLLNFTITPAGLEDQMLGVFVENELPQLQERKNTLVMQNASMKEQLKDIEDNILQLLSSSGDQILDNVELIDTLAQSKVTSEEIHTQVRAAEDTEREIDETREKYRPVATRASLLYFCITDLAAVDPMYQYSLQWFTNLFTNAIRDSEHVEDDIPRRIELLNNFFTALIYRNVCRSLFERHKLTFSFLMTQRVMQGAGNIPTDEWMFLISGQSLTPVERERPADWANSDWVDTRIWGEMSGLAGLPPFEGLLDSLVAKPAEWQQVFDSAKAHQEALPDGWSDKLTGLQRMCITRCLRPDMVVQAVQDFVTKEMGKEFIEPPPFDLQACYEDSNVVSPLIFVLSTGSDPTRAFFSFAEQVGMRHKLDDISLGQGQDRVAAAMIERAKTEGKWVLLHNCHLMASWMSELERICEGIDPDHVNQDFRLWLTSMPSKAFPVSILQNGVKMTNEPPKGLRANMRNFYYGLTDADLQVTTKPEAYRKLLFGLAFFHANVQERKKFGPLGWNVQYEFNQSDLEISRRQLEMYLDEYELIPYQVLNFLTSYINYGGRVTDATDLRTIDVILKDYFTAEVQEEGYSLSPSGTYYTIEADEDAPHQSYMEYLDSLPINPDPEVFGMHPNANITCDQNDTYAMFETLVSLQPRAAGGSGKSQEEIIAETAASILERMPECFDVEAISMQYPVKYEESMNTVLVQECIRYNRLVGVMRQSLADVQRALQGLVVMSAELDAMGNALATQKVPELWEAKAYPSLKPLGPWVTELLQRLAFINDWAVNGKPAIYWISGFYFPQAFLTGTLQNYARANQLPIDSLSFSFLVQQGTWQEVQEPPEAGCLIRGLFLEGARWNPEKKCIDDSLPKQLFTELPPLHLLPVRDRKEPEAGVYRCPVYKVLSRRGTLSTTGHSTNFVMFIELPADRGHCINNINKADSSTWIKAGVAAFCALRY